ncbi:MAG: hypothetical protein WCC48_15355 [Anaeromyxobacteraceae bacterium]
MVGEANTPNVRMPLVERARRRLRPWRDRLERSSDRASGTLGRMFADSELGDWRDVPVVINSFNRLKWLREQLDWLRRAGMRRLLVLDNASTYAPLLEYLSALRDAEVVRLGRNAGCCALWRTSAWQRVKGSWYVYTDPDVIPVDECPGDVVRRLHEVLLRHPWAHKAGLGLKIDDIPQAYPRREEVMRWEVPYWKKPLEEEVFDAPVDTTFALYRPWARGGWWIPAVRTGGWLLARHKPWYVDPAEPDEEDRHYQSAISRDSTYWTP